MAEDQKLSAGPSVRRGPRDPEMIATLFLSDPLDARAAQLTPSLGDDRAATIHRGLFEAGRLRHNKLP